MPRLSMITNFYNGHDTVNAQLDLWRRIDPAVLRHIEFLLVDDCSDVIPDIRTHGLNVRLLRVDTDISWNQPGARNLGALNARGEWALFFDIDQILDVGEVGVLLDLLPRLDSKTMYYMTVKQGLFNAIDNQKREFHAGSFLVRTDDFRAIGLYDEDFSGHYGFDDVYLPCLWDSDGGKRTVLMTPSVFERELDFATPGLDRDLSHNREVLNQKLASLMQPSRNPASESRRHLRFDWHEVDLRNRPRVMSKLWNGIEPFAHFPARLFAVNPTDPSPNHALLARTLAELRPEIIVKLGVWKGASTINMANTLRELAIDGVVIAVDTWLGAWHQWVDADMHAELCFVQGFPSLYQKFLATVLSFGLEDFVVPCPLDAANAAQLMAARQIVPSMVHMDGTHDLDAMQQNLRRWWPLLAAGGTMICDDDHQTKASWPDMQRAVEGFLATTPHMNFECSPHQCRFQKPA